MNLLATRVLETAAMLMIGDGVLACAAPKAHSRLWLKGPGPWRRMVEPFVERPNLTAGLGALGLAAGLALAHYAQDASRNA